MTCHVIYFRGRFVKQFASFDLAYAYGFAKWGGSKFNQHDGWVLKKVTG